MEKCKKAIKKCTIPVPQDHKQSINLLKIIDYLGLDFHIRQVFKKLDGL
jgi:hypothetical protein